MKHLIKIVKGEPVVSTEVIAGEFGRRHDNVMQNIRSLIESDHLGPLDFKESSYVNKQNKVQPCYELTERGFLIAMPFIGGEKARDGQVRLVDSFIEYREKVKRESAIQAERDLARVEYRPMTNAIKQSKEAEGKEAEHYHFSNEANLINRIVLGNHCG
ncbi:Rha family transcriptional regulator [Salmonella enterica]